MKLLTILIVPALFFRTLDYMLLEEKQQPQPCSSAEAKQFDFWVGDWNLSWTAQDGKQKTGVNKISQLYGGCVIKEEFADPVGGFAGMSVSTYDVYAKKWKQTWVDNTGSYLDFVGEYRDGYMVLSRKMQKQGKEFIQRMRWYDIAANSLKWNWERSDDNGKTWTVIWKISYTRKGKA